LDAGCAAAAAGEIVEFESLAAARRLGRVGDQWNRHVDEAH
jgi:hypothetical protein